MCGIIGILGKSAVQALSVQMISYYAALAKGTEVDQPKNLAKSVTVE